MWNYNTTLNKYLETNVQVKTEDCRLPEKIAILADSGSDSACRTVKQIRYIEVAPMLVTMAGEEYRRQCRYSRPEEFYARLGKDRPNFLKNRPHLLKEAWKPTLMH